MIKISDQVKTRQKRITVLGVRRLTSSTTVLRFERTFDFTPGQYIRVGLPGGDRLREYSIYSSVHDEAGEILIKEVLDGEVSPPLCRCKPGDQLVVEGPFGWFTLDEEARQSGKLVFVATGTGIAPFHSMIGSYPELDCQVIHGVSHAAEVYDAEYFSDISHTACVSRELTGDYHGRVTRYLETFPVHPEQRFYFCGNSKMILETFQQLTDRGIDRDRMFAEIYF